MNNYSFHINATPSGFYDKSVLEAISAGLFNFILIKITTNFLKKMMHFLQISN